MENFEIEMKSSILANTTQSEAYGLYRLTKLTLGSPSLNAAKDSALCNEAWERECIASTKQSMLLKNICFLVVGNLLTSQPSCFSFQNPNGLNLNQVIHALFWLTSFKGWVGVTSFSSVVCVFFYVPTRIKHPTCFFHLYYLYQLIVVILQQTETPTNMDLTHKILC